MNMTNKQKIMILSSLIFLSLIIMKQQDSDFQVGSTIRKCSNETQSFKLKDYMSYFAIGQFADIKFLQSQLLQLLPSDISYDKQSEFASNLIVKVTKCTNNHEIIDVQARLGYFIFHRISIIKVKRQSQTHQTETDLRGSFCNVYRCQCNGIPLAVKCFLKLEEQTQSNDVNILGSVIEEYCILKLASCFKVGPKVYDNFECAIVAYPECIEICMELCSPLPKISELTKKRIQRDLKENLGKLHSLSIIHYDIKTENICFSNVFDKYVFIDFGMGKIVKETIGFKSVSGYRGTFNYSSEQMTQLFFLDPKRQRPIDLFCNDLVALRKTVNNLQFRNQICDTQAYYKDKNQEMQQIANIKDVTKIYNLYNIKYNIYQQYYEPLSKAIAQLSTQQIEELFKFVKGIKGSILIYKKEKQIFTIFDKNPQFKEYFFNKTDFNQDQTEKTQIMDQLNRINKKSPLAYFFNFFHQNFSQLILILKDPLKIAKIELLDYFCLLSKAIQVNASTLSLEQRESICESGSERLKELKIQQKNSPKQQNIISQVSRLLFIKACENNLVGKYFQIFCSIINNIFFFELLSEQKIIFYYKLLLMIKLPFKKKLISLVKFNSALVWQHMATAFEKNYLRLRTKIDQINETFCFQSLDHFQKPQAELLKMVLIRQYQSQNTLTYCRKLSKEISLSVQMYSIFGKLKHFQNNNELLLNNYRILKNQLQFFSKSLFQYYDYTEMFYNYVELKRTNLIQKCLRIIKIKQSSPLCIVAKSITAFQRHKNIQVMLAQIQHLSPYSHQIVRRIIYYFLLNIFFTHRYQLNKCKCQLIQKYYSLRLQYYPQPLKYDFVQNFELRCQRLINKLFWNNQITTNFINLTGKTMRMDFLEEIKSNYLVLNQQLKGGIKKNNHRTNNNRLMSWNFLITIFLICKGKFTEALQLAKYLLRLSIFTYSVIVNKNVVLELILAFIIQELYVNGYEAVKEQNRHLYFEYLRMVSEKDNQERLILSSKILVDILQLMYKFKPEELFPLISKVFTKLSVNSTRNNTQKIKNAFQLLFYRNHTQLYFIKQNICLQKQISDFRNPYKLILLYLIIRYKGTSNPISRNDFINIFRLLDRVNAYLKEYIVRKIYVAFLASLWATIKERRRLRINRKIVEYDWLSLSTKQMFKLFIPQKSVRTLYLSHNLNKKQSIINALQQYRRNIHQTKFQFCSIKTQYGKIIVQSKRT